ncbi:hypothetical protein B566_EDAN014537 [Ephemera danica]|nr:hypothetical protein B566_EDAN014537 [Ephemera danica]
MTSNTLRIRNLPPELTIDENIDLLNHFGATKVDCIGTKNVTAFARFENSKAATVALGRLHQLDVLGYLLRVDYAPPSQETPSNPDHTEKRSEGATRYETFLRKLNAWSLGLDFTQPPPAHLRQYPMPTEASRHEEVDMQTSSTESEMESDGETPRERSPPPRLPAKRPRRTLKRTKLITKSQGVPSPAGPSQHKIELKLTSTSTASSLAETPPSDSSGFGVLFPPVPETPETEQPPQEVSESDGTTITVAQLRANRLPDREGRMRGQAFVTYPSVPQAQSALQGTNGYLLQDKPLVVQFARSAKPKTAEAT